MLCYKFLLKPNEILNKNDKIDIKFHSLLLKNKSGHTVEIKNRIYKYKLLSLDEIALYIENATSNQMEDIDYLLDEDYKIMNINLLLSLNGVYCKYKIVEVEELNLEECFLAPNKKVFSKNIKTKSLRLALRGDELSNFILIPKTEDKDVLSDSIWINNEKMKGLLYEQNQNDFHPETFYVDLNQTKYNEYYIVMFFKNDYLYKKSNIYNNSVWDTIHFSLNGHKFLIDSHFSNSFSSTNALTNIDSSLNNEPISKFLVLGSVKADDEKDYSKLSIFPYSLDIDSLEDIEKNPLKYLLTKEPILIEDTSY